MIIKILGLIIGLLIACAGIYYLRKEKDDQESRKIYSIVSAIGIIISIVSLLLLII